MKKELTYLAAASLGLMSLTSTAFADEEVKAAPSLSSVLEASGITATGYVAASYYHSDQWNTDHQFDIQHETFQLDQAAFTLAYQPKEGFGALVNVVAGQDARIINGATNGDADAYSLAHESPYSIAQAYVQYAGGPVTIIAGKFATLAGAEVFAPTGNTNFSRSLLFFNEPLVHTGIRGTFAAGDMFTFTLGVNNGWNYDSTSQSKTTEIGIGFTPSKKFSLLAQGYSGQDALAVGKKTLVDLVATFNATDALTFILSYDTGKQDYDSGDPSWKWNGAAGYVNYAFNDQWRVSVRGEYLTTTFDNGAPDQKLNEVTLTFGYAPVKSFELRAEVRQDSSNKDAANFPDGLFPKYKPTQAPFSTDSQLELALQGVYKF